MFVFVVYCLWLKNRIGVFFFFSSRRRHTRSLRDWSSDVCSSDLATQYVIARRNLKREGILMFGAAALLLVPAYGSSYIGRTFGLKLGVRTIMRLYSLSVLTYPAMILATGAMVMFIPMRKLRAVLILGLTW